jgi:Phage integrase family
VIRIQRSWDVVEGMIEPKSAKGRRTVQIPGVLRSVLVEHRLRTGGTGLVFGMGERPFRPDLVRHAANRAWDQAGLRRISLHECRHSYASLMISAGANAKTISTYMGHANIAITLDKYGHLLPGNEAEAAGMLDAFLERTVAHTPNRQSTRRIRQMWYIGARLARACASATSATVDSARASRAAPAACANTPVAPRPSGPSSSSTSSRTVISLAGRAKL